MFEKAKHPVKPQSINQIIERTKTFGVNGEGNHDTKGSASLKNKKE